MRGKSMLAAVGALAFGIITFVAFLIADPPGGSYSEHDAATYVTKDHRPSVFISFYLVLLGGIGLALLLARLRDAIADGGRGSLFWGFGVAAVAAWVGGYALVIAGPAAFAFSGGNGFTLDHNLVYMFSEAGFALMYGAGGTLLGCALVTFAAGPVAAPAWVRWATLVAGIAGIASLAWFPFFLVYLWAIVLGLWLIASDRAAAPVAQPA
jgi:hypothetical protein